MGQMSAFAAPVFHFRKHCQIRNAREIKAIRWQQQRPLNI
jgi:hypothetical protein